MSAGKSKNRRISRAGGIGRGANRRKTTITGTDRKIVISGTGRKLAAKRGRSTAKIGKETTKEKEKREITKTAETKKSKTDQLPNRTLL